MRLYITVRAAVALELIEQGFRDLHEDMGQVGVWCDYRPRGCIRPAAGTGVVMGGPQGDTTLCVDVPEDVFRGLEHEEGTRPLTPEESARIEQGAPWPEDLEYQRMGYAIIPPEVLNRCGRPQLYDHIYAGCSRRLMLRMIPKWESKGSHKKAAEMRAAFEFFDRVGWQTALRLKGEEPPPDDLPPWFRVTGFEPAE
jgi:hypothetical protein